MINDAVQFAFESLPVRTDPGAGQIPGNRAVGVKSDDFTGVFRFIDIPLMKDDFIGPGLLLRRDFFRHLAGITPGQHDRPAVFVHHHLMHTDPELLAAVREAGMENDEIPAGFRLIKG